MIDMDYIIPNLVFYSHRRCTPTWNIGKNIINFHDLTYVVSGSGVYLIDGHEIPVKKGDLIYIPSNSQREAYTSPDDLMELYAVNFRLFEINSVNNLSMLPFGKITKIGIKPQLISNYRKLTNAWTERNECYVMETRALFMLILTELVKEICYNRQPLSLDNRILQVENYIRDNYNRPLTMNLLANEVKLNPIYLGSLFKESTGLTIREYINMIRIANAEMFMKSERLTLSEAANKCGFKDAFYFSKVFKKYKGYPPSNVNK